MRTSRLWIIVVLTSVAVAAVSVSLASDDGPRSGISQESSPEAAQPILEPLNRPLAAQDTPDQPLFHAQSDASFVVGSPIGDDCWTLELNGNHLYAAFGSAFKVFSLADPAIPTEVGSFDDGTEDIVAIAIAGDSAYALDALRGLRVLDISDPTNVTSTAYSTITVGTPRVMVADDDRLYVGEAPSARVPTGLRAIDVSSPSSPVELDLAPIQGFEARDLAMGDDIIYVAGWRDVEFGELQVYDVSDPSALRFVAAAVPEGAISGLALKGNHVFMNVMDPRHAVAKLEVADVEFPEELYILTRYDYPATDTMISDPEVSADRDTAKLYRLALEDSLLASIESRDLRIGSDEPPLLAKRLWLRAFDVTDPELPITLGAAELPVSYARDLAISGDYVYIAAPEDGLFVVQIIR